MSGWQRTRIDPGSGRMRPRQFAHLDGHDAYEVLGVDAEASRAEIEVARRNLVKVLHPDRPGGDAARMSLVNAAADILLDTAKRADYDAYVADGRPRRTAAPATPRSAPAPRRPVRPESAAEPADAADYEAADYEAGDYEYGDPIDYEPTPARRRGPRSGGLFGRARHRPETLDPDSLYRPSPPPRPKPSPPRQKPTPRQAPAPRAASTRGPAPRTTPTRTAPPRAEPPRAPGSSWVGTAGVPDRAPLPWQPPPPGRLARWHAKRQYGRQVARGQRVSPSGGPLVVVGLLATVIAICAIGGVLIGISTGTGSAGTPAPARTTPHPATTTHPGTKPATHPAPKPTPKPSGGRPKPTGTHRS